MFTQKFYDGIKGFQFRFARGIVYGEESSKSSYPHQITIYQKMSGLETNFKSTRPRPGYYKTETETASKRPRPSPKNWSRDLHHWLLRQFIMNGLKFLETALCDLLILLS